MTGDDGTSTAGEGGRWALAASAQAAMHELTDHAHQMAGDPQSLRPAPHCETVRDRLPAPRPLPGGVPGRRAERH